MLLLCLRPLFGNTDDKAQGIATLSSTANGILDLWKTGIAEISPPLPFFALQFFFYYSFAYVNQTDRGADMSWHIHGQEGSFPTQKKLVRGDNQRYLNYLYRQFS